MDERRLETLWDHMKITETVTRYATSIGMHDWEGLRSCYAEEVEIDYTSMIGGEPTRYKAEDWVAWARNNASGFAAVMHYLSNHTITVNGDDATCISYVNSQFYLPNDKMDSMWAGGGYYTNGLIRTSGGWKICKTKLTVKWTRGNPEIFALANEMAAAVDQG